MPSAVVQNWVELLVGGPPTAQSGILVDLRGPVHLRGLQAMAVTALRQGACANLPPAESWMLMQAPAEPTASSDPP